MGRPVVHFEVMSKDATTARAFYSDLFGWSFDDSSQPGYGLISRKDNLSPDGIGIGGGVGQAPDGYDGHVTFYVEVPDVAEAIAQAQALGGRHIWGPEQVNPSVEIALIADPEGRTIGLLR